MLETRRRIYGGIEDKGAYTREWHRSGSYWKGRTDVITITPKNKNPDTPHQVVMPGYTANGNPHIAEDIATRLALSTGGTTDVFTVSGFLRGRRLSKETQEEFPYEPVRDNVRWSGRSTLEVNRAATLLRNLRERKIKSARILSHSLGVQSTAHAMALDKEGLTNNGVSVASAGVNNERPVKNIMWRFGTDSIREAWEGRKNEYSKKARKLLAGAVTAMLIKHPIRFLWHEIRAAKYGNVVKTILDADVNLRFLTGTRDLVFNDSEFSREKRLQERKKSYEGTHNTIYTDPDFVGQKVIPLFEQPQAA